MSANLARPVPILVFTMPTDHRWHPGAVFGLSAQGTILGRNSDGDWYTSCHGDNDGSGVCAKALEILTTDLLENAGFMLVMREQLQTMSARLDQLERRHLERNDLERNDG